MHFHGWSEWLSIGGGLRNIYMVNLNHIVTGYNSLNKIFVITKQNPMFQSYQFFHTFLKEDWLFPFPEQPPLCQMSSMFLLKSRVLGVTTIEPDRQAYASSLWQYWMVMRIWWISIWWVTSNKPEEEKMKSYSQQRSRQSKVREENPYLKLFIYKQVRDCSSVGFITELSVCLNFFGGTNTFLLILDIIIRAQKKFVCSR